MMIQAVLGNPHHPEYGVATIPFPIPHDQYAHCMELLEALEIGDAVKADCQVEEIDSFYSVLKRMEMLTVNVELNYLAKRLDSFDTGEAAQFQAVAHKLELFELKDLINLTFCCQQATVITDFSDLSAVGRNHYMNLHEKSANHGVGTECAAPHRLRRAWDTYEYGQSAANICYRCFRGHDNAKWERVCFGGDGTETGRKVRRLRRSSWTGDGKGFLCWR